MQDEILGQNALEHHLELYNRLADRSVVSAPHYKLLEDVLGFSLENAVISTSEHAAPFNFASSVSYVLPQWSIQRAALRPPATIVVLVGTLVPFDNRHYPRGFLFDNGKRFNLVGQKVAKSCPALQPPVDVRQREGGDAFVATYPFLRPHLTGEIPFTDVGHQIASVMEKMASTWIANEPSPVRILSLEEVARRLLIRLLEERDPWLEKMLFDRPTRHKIFQGLMGTFCAWGLRHGSFLFWKGTTDRIGRFVEENDCLVSDELSIPLTREALIDALKERRIWPGVYLCLTVISYLTGLAVAGGPKQPDYYYAMIRVANEVGGMNRELSLSTYGYTCMDLTRVTPNKDEPRKFPLRGAGLWLSQGQTDPSWFCNQLSTIPVLPTPPAPTYD